MPSRRPLNSYVSKDWIARSSAAPGPARSRLSRVGIYTEMQAGSYVFMDADYARNLDEDGNPVSTFRHALFVLATVMSAPHTGLAVLDAGHKAVPIDSGMPSVWQKPDIRYVSASDEHGKLLVGSETTMPKLGEKLRSGAGTLRPDGRSLRLVCRRAWRTGGEPVAGRSARCDGLTRQSGHSRRLRASGSVSITGAQAAAIASRR